jgi:hypothetical protein
MFSPARAYGYHGLQQWRGATDVTLEKVACASAPAKTDAEAHDSHGIGVARFPALISGDAWRAPHLFSRKWTSTHEQTVTRFGIHL